MDEQERAGFLETLASTPARLKAALAGVPRKLLLWTPAPGKWSIQEIVCHMRDMEREAYLARYQRIMAEDNPTLPDIDGDRYALERDYRSLKLGEVLRDWARARKECLKILKKVKGDSWQRVGTHETAGPLSMEAFLRRHAAGNDGAHLGQIEAIKGRFETLAKLDAGPAALAEATRGLSDDDWRRRPTPDKWSIVEIACHLRDLERLFAERFAKMAWQERPALWMADNDRMAEALRYREADPAAVTREWKRLRGDTLTLLRALPHAAWQRTGLHPKRGEVTIEQLASVLVGHDQSHIERVRTMRPTA
jgi:hypothetical protein